MGLYLLRFNPYHFGFGLFGFGDGNFEDSIFKTGIDAAGVDGGWEDDRSTEIAPKAFLGKVVFFGDIEVKVAFAFDTKYVFGDSDIDVGEFDSGDGRDDNDVGWGLIDVQSQLAFGFRIILFLHFGRDRTGFGAFCFLFGADGFFMHD